MPPKVPKDDSQLQVTLGDGTAELSGMWKFHTGDDIAWAQPDFDDSGWRSIDATPAAGTEDTALGTSGFIPWLDRLMVTRATPDTHGTGCESTWRAPMARLRSKCRMDVDDAYQFYVNGKQIGELGKFTKHGRVTPYSTLPRRLPTSARTTQRADDDRGAHVDG